MKEEEMDTDIIKPEWYLVTMVFLNGLRLIFQLHTLKKQVQRGEITKEKMDTSYVVTTLIKLDRYVSAVLDLFKRKYSKR